ncbi:MAG: cytochrome c maturation protein CcmE [Pseudomonadota bacterium]|jgi:cytochrome c-type biogenesis protein CcmE|nr:cytochrome c maturation protein CcmE [Hyphomicrobiales bacterium]MEC7088348.1 cytochrome c maturation protein CcmE [Pseudomonadota bacterium]MEC7090410.1 cytochrome c maturation protein CcmE [Pseudomonadota bacterium]MEC7270375.1 cytochrome c maturation protein CcmE [Pseudomonadota bacterium]MEC8315351.1 cytochrome c maturation protein CcmE [Pseudomonadota bacterium]|tara:strand:+ start:303 stop:710 length:408 start_codon:yes stop_codon:yes gene_type:complete
MTNKAKRLYFYTTATLLSAFAVALVLIALDENIIYFYSPSEVNQSEAATLLRVGGLVKDGSLKIDNDLGIKFIIEDNIAEVSVIYNGILPDLFREGQGVIAEGKFIDNFFIANEIVAKHDENYMPKEVYESLKNK